tara:strand:- start:2959 stop:3891 length:933 start_codon:yes stop_codon:yes gene_type:complete
MELNILKALKLYILDWKIYYKYFLIIVLLALAISSLETKKYTAYFSFYQKSSSDAIGLLQSFTSIDSENLPLKSVVGSKQLYMHLSKKKWSGKHLWEILNVGQGLRAKISDHLFFSNIDSNEINIDRTIELLQSKVIKIRENNADSSISIFVETSSKELSKEISNEIVLYVNNYYSNVLNESALQKTNFINKRILDLEFELDNIRNEIISFKENNKNLDSPKLVEELKMLESKLLLKSQVYIELYSNYEFKLLESIDKSNAVFLINDINTLAKPSSPNVIYNLLISIFVSFLITFILSIKKNNSFKLNVF